MIKRFTLALALSAAVLVLLPASAFAVWHAESTVNSRTWQYPNGAANLSLWVRVNFDVSDSHPGVYRLTSYSMRQTKNAGNVYVIGKIRGCVCGHDYYTDTGGHGAVTDVDLVARRRKRMGHGADAAEHDVGLHLLLHAGQRYLGDIDGRVALHRPVQLHGRTGADPARGEVRGAREL